jgi:ankyrin repeat protein
MALDFHLAAELGQVEYVQARLAEDGGAVGTLDERGATALHGACYWGQLGAARALLAAGADSKALTRDSFLQISPLGSAVAATPGVAQPSDDEDVVLALVRLLLEYNADPNQRRLDGSTPLHGAAWRGLGRVVQELLDAGADPRMVVTSGPHQGETAADTALAQGHLILAARLDSGVVDVASPYG